MNITFLYKYYPYFLTGAKNTLIVAIFTVFLGVALGTIFALMKLSRIKVVSFIASTYIEFLRGTPVLVQLYIIYYGLPMLGIKIPDIPALGNFSDFVAGIITLSINSSAYVAEIIRAGINSVDKGQMEAARSLGLKHSTSMRHIIIPQAMKNILPALGNEFIVVIKESSIVSIIGIPELMYNAEVVRGVTFMPFEPLIIAAIMYFIMTFTLSKLMGRFERRLRRVD